MRRFYKQADADACEGGFVLTLDGKPVRTPAGTAMALSPLALVAAIAGEWEAQEEEIVPHAMPLTNLASLALDYVGPEREAVVAEMLNYATTDLLCYRVATPETLARRQAEAWQPLLDWAAERFQAPLVVTTELDAIEQPAAALVALKAAISDLDDLRLTALRSLTAMCSSLILGLALVEERIDGATAWTLSQLDEDFQIEKWGEDADAAARRHALRENMMAVERFLALAASRPPAPPTL